MVVHRPLSPPESHPAGARMRRAGADDSRVRPEHLPRRGRWWLGLGALAAALFFGASALAQSGVQRSPDGKRTLVSKDLGAERWAIVLNPDETVTGNVFSPGGGESQFVWCETTRVRRGERTLTCSGAGRCLAAPCTADQWTLIGEVTIDEAFFSPPEAVSATGEAPRALAAATSTATSGLRRTPDAKLVLVSKDVGGDRWAIARDPSDGTVTGNVFDPDGGPARFVWCEPAGTSSAVPPSGLQLSCFVADRCAAAPCDERQWTFIADVPLPSSFFEEPVCGDGATQPGEECDDGNTQNADACSNACVASRCGDLVVQSPEECDDGNDDDLDACSNQCVRAFCGDGRQQTGEQCDDGNRNDADGCTNACQRSVCGDGVCGTGESCETCGQDCGGCPCLNIAGDWSYSERGTVDCGADVGRFQAGGQGSATVVQSACNVVVTVSVQGVQFSMRGIVEGSEARLSGPLYYSDLLELPPGIDVRDDGWNWQGSIAPNGFRLDGSGRFRVVAGGITAASCSVSSRHDFDR